MPVLSSPITPSRKTGIIPERSWHGMHIINSPLNSHVIKRERKNVIFGWEYYQIQAAISYQEIVAKHFLSKHHGHRNSAQLVSPFWNVTAVPPLFPSIIVFETYDVFCEVMKSEPRTISLPLKSMVSRWRPGWTSTVSPGGLMRRCPPGWRRSRRARR